MNRPTLGALCAFSLLATTPALAAVRSTPDAGRVTDARVQALDALRSRSVRGGDSLKIHDGAFGMPRYLSGVLSGARPAGATYEAHARQFLTSQPALFPLQLGELRLRRTMDDAVGGKHLRFEQYYHGVPVMNATLVVHMDRDGVVRAVNSSAVAGLQLNTTPTLSKEEAYARVNRLDFNDLIDIHDAELLIFPTRARHSLAWKVPLMLEVGPRVVFIDAHTGQHIWTENPMRDASTTGTGIDAQGNAVDSLNIYQGRAYIPEVSPLLRPYIQTAARGRFNLVDETTPDLGKIYTLTSNETYLMDIDWVNSSDKSFDESADNNNHPAGVSAHQYYRQTLDFYKTVFNRNGLDDEGLSITAIVEIMGLPDYPLECNAGWLGSGFNFMIFGMGGDCYGYETYPFSASLDVIGHELNHGVNEFTINLGYNHESGALNEHFADVFGVLVESYYQGGDWLIGEDLFVNQTTPETAFRDFANPGSDAVLTAQPDSMNTYFSAPASYDAGGVHFNSGIVNRAFYLVVEGGTVNGVTVPKVGANADEGRSIAGAIWYDVMKSERISNISQFNDLRDALIDSAEMLRPSAVSSIQKAFQAVGVMDDLYPTSSQDRAEPNDYPGLAMPLSMNATTEQYIWSQNDSDIYVADLNAGQSVTIALSNLGFDAYLSVYSVGPYETLTEQGKSNNAGTANESITFTPTTGGSYYIEVIPYYSAGSRGQKYSLSLSRG